jgi:type IV pilus assembly protein PilY1
MKLLNCVLLSAVFLFLGFGPASADDADLYTVNVAPDALLVLDLSGSMRWTPSGETMYIDESQTCGTDVAYYPTSGSGHTKACTIDAYGTVPKYGNDASCSGPFYRNSGTGYSTDCSRLAIGKKSIYDLLNDYHSTPETINNDDETSLGIRFAYMRFTDGNDATGDYNSGNIRLGRKNSLPPPSCTESTNTADTLVIGSSFSDIFNRVNCESANSGTPLAASLNEAKSYLDYHRNGDPAKDCRKKFVILITDGSDTYACSGNGTESQTDQYKRRRETVAKAKALSDAGYYVFVIGFGANMPHYPKNTLNWTAYYAGTDNPLVDNSGDTKGYDPANVSSCHDDYPSTSPPSHDRGDGLHYYAASNDPGEADLSGYAFLATTASELTTALKMIARDILKRSYSFSVPAISIVRIQEQEIGYISSFTPNITPIWKGDISAYQLDVNGLLVPIEANKIWSAFEKLNSLAPNDRSIYTTVDNVNRTIFDYSHLSNADLDVSSDPERANLINHIRGTDAYDLDHDSNTTEPREWKLEDIIHSNPIIVGEPSRFFVEEGYSGSGGFYEANKNRTKIIIVGANDGMLHAFDTAAGIEKWAFIPNSLLKELKQKISFHDYYVDSSPKVADVWFDLNGDNKKTANEWKTVLVCGLRKGGKHYFALDITDTLNPKYLWEFPNPSDAATLAKVGQSWSEPAIGRVKIEQASNLVERWVAFIGGGFDPNETRTTPASVGKALFVIDIRNGNIIKEFSGSSGMTYSLAAPPTAVDTNSDGFVDKVYIGDLGGQMWVSDVSFNEATKKSDSLWTGRRLFEAPGGEKHSIYYQPAVALDRYGKPWVYFGTGDRENPKDYQNPPERFYAVKDDGLGNYPRKEADLKDVTIDNTFTIDQTKEGWFIQLEKTGKKLEKVLAKPVVFNQLIYFTTYTYTESADPCSVAGTAKAYIVEYRSGGGAASTLGDYAIPSTPSDRSVPIGSGASGVPSAPVISVNSEGKASVTITTTMGQILSEKAFSPTAIKAPLYWREVVH